MEWSTLVYVNEKFRNVQSNTLLKHDDRNQNDYSKRKLSIHALDFDQIVQMKRVIRYFFLTSSIYILRKKRNPIEFVDPRSR